jgi:hypothetical protein
MSQAATDTTSPAGPADSLVGRMDGWSFWFTLSRSATDSTGQPCAERGLEIRSDSTRRLVPLLYTREAPMPESDSTVLVHLYNQCVPGRLYRVDLRTALPTPADR